MDMTKISKSKLGFFAFFSLVCLDFISYKIEALIGHGFYAGILAVSIGFLLLLSMFRLSGRKLIDFLFISILLFAPVVIAGSSSYFDFEDVFFWIKTLCYYAIGYFYAIFLLKNNREKFGLMFLFFLICILSILLIPGEGQNYLRLADGFVLLSFYLMAFSKRVYLKLAFFFVASASLYVINSRFSMMSFVFISLAVYIYKQKMTKLLPILISLGCSLLVVYVKLKNYFLTLSSIDDNRILRLVFATNQDSSLIQRNMMLEWSIKIFKENPILGKYKYYYGDGRVGSYAHNFMSFWSELGVVGITQTLVIALLCIKSLFLLRQYKENVPNIIEYSAYISLLVLLGLIASKSYLWPTYYLSIGFLYVVNLKSRKGFE